MLSKLASPVDKAGLEGDALAKMKTASTRELCSPRPLQRSWARAAMPRARAAMTLCRVRRAAFQGRPRAGRLLRAMAAPTDSRELAVSPAWLAGHLRDADVKILDVSWYLPAQGAHPSRRPALLSQERGRARSVRH